MSTENTTVDTVNDDLDAFSADFFGQKEAITEPASSEEHEDIEKQEIDAPEDEDTHDEADTLDSEDDSNDEEEEKEDPAPKPKRNRAQERIEELNTKYRETERKLNEVLEQLAKKEKTEPAPKQAEVTGPTPNDSNEDGTDKYPLGEFDPGYIRDLTRFTLEQERETYRAKEKEEAAQRQVEKEREALQTEWQGKLGPAQERYPDFVEKGEQLFETFDNIDQSYGEYLAATIMGMEFGPDVLYYLANNTDEAQKIVNSGPTMATIKLGRLEAKFADVESEKQKARPKVSNAPSPPPTNKGASAAKASVEPDTDDLDAFAETFFPSKKRGK